jgi:hypothetical protein
MSAHHRSASLSFLFILLLGCASGPDSKPVWVSASDADFSAFDSFGWAGPEREPATILDSQIRDAIRTQLLAKGYTEAAGEPDLLIRHETIEKDALKQGNPVRIGIGVGSWGGNVGGSVGTSVDVGEKDQLVQQLQIAIHALDPGEDREVWAGNTAALPERPDSAAVNRAVSSLLEGFPGKNGNPQD